MDGESGDDEVGITRQFRIDVVSADVWITTGGTMYDVMARYIGENIHTCMQQSGDIYSKPVLIGFANLNDITNRNEISNSAVDLSDIDQQVFCRSFLPRDAMHKRGQCRHAVPVCLSICLSRSWIVT